MKFKKRNFSVDKCNVILLRKSDSTYKSLGSKRAHILRRAGSIQFCFVLECDGLLLIKDIFTSQTIFNEDTKISQNIFL